MTSVTTQPRYLNARTNIYTAWDLRKDNERGAGVFDYESFRVLQTQSGATLGVDIGKTAVGLMRAQVRGSTRDGQGIYSVDNIDPATPLSNGYLSQLNVAVTSNASGNPRLDQIVLQVEDSQHAGSNNLASVVCLPGTPSAPVTIDNRTGAAALPANSILLADIIVASGAVTIVTANIRDRRQKYTEGTGGIVPAVDLVGVALSPAIIPLQSIALASMATALQSAVAIYLPRRIKGATKIRWTYLHGATAMTGNYVIGIYDSSGRKIVDTGTVAFTGALNTYQQRAETITATDFEPGIYYVLYGHAPAAGGCNTAGAQFAANTMGPAYAGQFLGTGSGGATAPQTILAFTDLIAGSGSNFMCPIIALSVG